MATWTTLPDATLEPGKPIRSIDVLALRDNPVAIAEGASGAPKIDPINAMAHLGAVGAVGTYAFLVLGEIASGGSVVNVSPGETRPGSSLRYANAGGAAQGSITPSGSSSAGTLFSNSGAAPAGTWRCMGYVADYDPGATEVYSATLWLRIA